MVGLPDVLRHRFRQNSDSKNTFTLAEYWWVLDANISGSDPDRFGTRKGKEFGRAPTF